ncbi:MAG: DUF4143 domain-containing protein [bacterium]
MTRYRCRFAEQFIGQHLLYRNDGQEAPKLHFWLREKKTSNAEVDYVISRGNVILPVEVKAGKSGSLKSVLQFVIDKKAELAIRFDLNLPSIQKVCHKIQQNQRTENVTVTLISLPLYLVGQLNNVQSTEKDPRFVNQTKRGIQQDQPVQVPHTL